MRENVMLHHPGKHRWALHWACKCGCSQESHRHYRRGSDCGYCGPVVCPKWRRRLHFAHT